MDGDSSRCGKLESILQDGSLEPHHLPLGYLRNITNNFSEERVLGEGGFGTVYKGVLPNGKTIAVKKFNSSSPGVKDSTMGNTSAPRSQKGCFAWSTCPKEAFVDIFQVQHFNMFMSCSFFSYLGP